MVHGEGEGRMGEAGDERRVGRSRGAIHGGSRVLHGGACVKDQRKRQSSIQLLVTQCVSCFSAGSH